MSNKMAACEAECGQVISDNIEIQEKLEVQVRAEETEGGRHVGSATNSPAAAYAASLG